MEFFLFARLFKLNFLLNPCKDFAFTHDFNYGKIIFEWFIPAKMSIQPPIKILTARIGKISKGNNFSITKTLFLVADKNIL